MARMNWDRVRRERNLYKHTCNEWLIDDLEPTRRSRSTPAAPPVPSTVFPERPCRHSDSTTLIEWDGYVVCPHCSLEWKQS